MNANVKPWMVDPATGRALYTKCVFPEGTPKYGKAGDQNNRQYAYRKVWVEAHGPIPSGHCIDHLCNDNRCSNLEHLDCVTPSENHRRAVLRGTKVVTRTRWSDAIAWRVFEMWHIEKRTQAYIFEQTGVRNPTMSNWFAGRFKPHIKRRWLELGMPLRA